MKTFKYWYICGKKCQGVHTRTTEAETIRLGLAKAIVEVDENTEGNGEVLAISTESEEQSKPKTMSIWDVIQVIINEK